MYAEHDVSSNLKQVQRNVMVAIPEQQDVVEGAKLAEKLGLEQQVFRYQTKHPDIWTTFACFQLSETEKIIWRNFCTTSHVEGTREFKDYYFETIPVSVLKHWDEMKQQYPFEHFEIWSSSGGFEEHLLIGAFGASLCLLARWKDGTKNLLSYSQVCDHVYDSLHHSFRLDELPTKIADEIRRMQHSHLGKIQRETFFFPRKHCGAKTLAFKFGAYNKKTISFCPLCGNNDMYID